jgi:CheY-like chemotaxis protein
MSALRNVLVVDDDPVVGKSFNRVLSNKGYKVITAENAAQALEMLREQECDLVVTDIKMPGMDGLELAEHVKARRPWTPVVIVTGFGSPSNQARATAAGVAGFMHKPLSPEMIEKSVADALRVVEPAIAAPPQQPAREAVAAELPVRTSRLRSIVLFLAAPFIGLAYAVLLPIVGTGMLMWMGAQALMTRVPATRTAFKFLRTVGLVLAAPFIGLAYAVLLPFVGIAMLAWTAAQALKARLQTD